MKRFLAIFYQPNSIGGASIILAITLAISNLLGVIRDHFLAQKIPTDTLDIYYTAFRLPDLVFNIIILGAVSSAFIPVFTSIYEHDRDKAIRFANSLSFLISLVVGLLILLLLLIMPAVIGWIAPGFSDDKLSSTVAISRILLIGPLLFGLSYIFSGILQSWQRFTLPAFSPLVYNLSIILATVLYTDRFGLVAVAWGVIIGATGHAIIQLPVLINHGWRPYFFGPIYYQEIKRVIALSAPRAIGLGVNQLLLLVFTSIASIIGSGSIAIYNLADNIQTTPVVIVANSVASALFPTLSRFHAQENSQRFTDLLERSLQLVLFFLIPTSVGIILLRSQLVRLILGSGHFGWHETRLAANTLGGFAVGIVFLGLTSLLARAFYARHNTILPTVSNLIGAGVAVGLGYILARFYNVVGLSLSFSIGTALSAILMYWSLQKQIPINHRQIMYNIVQIIIATAAMAVAVQITKTYMGVWLPLNTGLAVLAQFGVASFSGLLVYLAVLWWLDFPQLKEILLQLKRILKII